MRTTIFKRLDLFLIAAALLAAVLNLYNIWQQTYVNAYYTSAVTSMLQSFHNFFYASFDPGGFVTVDKPPVTFWVQTVSAAIFGLHGWSVILPQALAGVGSVLLVYALVKPTFGTASARIAGFVFACTPIAAAVARTNNVDSLLVFTLLLAAWMLLRGIRTGKWGWIVGAFGTVGLAFNMKMLQAYMVIPAFYLLYLVGFKSAWRKKLGIIAAATVLLGAVSLSWAVAVDSVAKDSRPYIGSSQTNSVLELAFGYNGISRLTGDGMGGGGGGGKAASAADGRRADNGWQLQQSAGNDGATPTAAADGQQAVPNGSTSAVGQGQSADGAAPADGQGRSFDGAPPDGMPSGSPGQGFTGGGAMGRGGPMGGGGAFGTGNPGPLRLFQSGLSGQISWLLPLALIGAVGLLAGVRRRRPLTVKQKHALFWLAWLVPGMAFFSVAGFFHQYYLIMLAPPIAALAGAGWIELWEQYRSRDSWRGWLLPAAVAATTALQLYILSPYTAQIGVAWPIAVGAAGALCTAALALRMLRQQLRHIAAAAGLLALLAAPLYWAATPLLYGGNSMLPEAGPQLKQSAAQGEGGSPGMGQEQVNEQLLQYVTEHNTGETYLFATSSSTTAAPYIIETGKAVMAMGGFSGSDPILTADKLRQLVQTKQVKYFLLEGNGFGGRGSSELTDWIKANGTVVPSSEWQSSASAAASQTSPMRMGGSMTLYEVQSSQ